MAELFLERDEGWSKNLSMMQHWFWSIPRNGDGLKVSGSLLYLLASTNNNQSLDLKKLGPARSRIERGTQWQQAGGELHVCVAGDMVHLCIHTFLCKFRNLLKLKDSNNPPSPHPCASASTCDWIISLTPKRLYPPPFACVLIHVCKVARRLPWILFPPNCWLFFETGLLLAFSLSHGLVWLTSKNQGSSHLQPPNTGITNLCHHT